MSATTALAAPERTTAGSGFSPTHGVHVPCQVGRPKVTAVCGAVLDWDDEVPTIPELCVVCRDLRRCPVCDAPLVVQS